MCLFIALSTHSFEVKFLLSQSGSDVLIPGSLKRGGAWPLISYSVSCPLVCGRKLLDVKPQSITALLVSRKKDERRKAFASLVFFFLLNDQGCPEGTPLGGDDSERAGSLASEASGSFYNPGLSRKRFCLCLIGGERSKAGCPPGVTHRAALPCSFGKNDPPGWEGPLVWTETLGRDKRERQ